MPGRRCRWLVGAHLLRSLRLSRDLLPAGEALAVALSVVIEAADGEKTYWALQHAAAQADFHLRQSFALTLKVNPS